ncbi:MAG: squalene/phytoene synthase family protein [Gemmatimonadales bacterium]|nr:squalene/phytoene synthase family protein [Gemmatimonadales bacterium]MBA3556358.1 squalene/phytoene synthase family protein [Gemmatimonadales bacterium]
MSRSPLERSYGRAEETTALWARSFYFASRFLPPRKRRAVFALYDYCRHADNLVDARGDRPKAQVLADLTALGTLVRSIHAGDPPPGERWLALGDTLRRSEVPLAPLLELLEGVAMDLDDVAYPDFATLHRYCRLVAGGVGLMLGPVLGATSSRFREPGIGLGVAMQLTNVLRDVAEDLGAGRLYLPADELARFGLDRQILERRRATPEFVAFMRFQITRARALFAAADPVVGLFPRDGSRLTVRLLQRTYAGILDGIERLGYDVFRARAYVSGPRKLMILGRAVWSELPLPALFPSARSA